MQRDDVTFPSGDDRCAAWLYRPVGADPDGPSRTPILVMAHGLGANRELRLAAFAERFAAAGYACLVVDYRYFGASGGRPRHLLDIGAQREDWRAAVAFARTLPGIDPDRVVVWGTSFGGGHAIVTAADDRRVVAAISQCPFTDGVASALRISPLTSVRLAGRAVRDLLAAARGDAPVYVPVGGEPGTVALMTSETALEDYLALSEGRDRAVPQVPARVALRIPLARPGRRAKEVRCPMLVVICDRDEVAPAGPTARYAGQAPQGEAVHYDCGHFDIYTGEWFEKNVAAQLDFLARHVPVV